MRTFLLASGLLLSTFNGIRDHVMLSFRAHHLHSNAKDLLQRLEPCDDSLLPVIRGTSGYQIHGPQLSCNWLLTAKQAVEKYLQAYPAVAKVFSPLPFGTQATFELFWEGDETAFGETTGLSEGQRLIHGCALHLRASYLTRHKADGPLSTVNWDHYLRCTSAGTPYPSKKLFQPQELAAQIDALFESFFSETAAHLDLKPLAQGIPRESMTVPRLKLADRVELEVLEEKPIADHRKREWIFQESYFPTLLDEIQGYFASATAVPKEVNELSIGIGQSCIRPGFGRHQPSRNLPCFGSRNAVIVVTFRARDINGRELLPMTIPILQRKNSDEYTTYCWPNDYTDTIPLPYQPGLFRVLMKRINAELDMALNVPVVE